MESLDMGVIITAITFAIGMVLCGLAGVRMDVHRPVRPLSDHNQYALSMFLTGIVFVQVAIGREFGDDPEWVALFGLDDAFTAIIRSLTLISLIISFVRLSRSGDPPR